MTKMLTDEDVDFSSLMNLSTNQKGWMVRSLAKEMLFKVARAICLKQMKTHEEQK